jgi:deoxyhypusine synthase
MTEEHREIDLARVRTVPVAGRPNRVRSEDFARPPGDDSSFRAFLDSLPQILQARSLLAVIDAMADAARASRPVVCMMGGHIIKTGVGPVLIDLVRRGVITHLASNGSAVIHDYEMARWGGTSEDVEAGLTDGTFGMAEETGREMNEAITRGAQEGWGMGEALGRALEAADTGHPEHSLLLAARKHGIPFTVHAALGAEITHQHPAADGAAIGDTSHRDFRRLAAALERLEGGVVLNLGSAVIMPEVFLKALTVCRNVNDGRPRAFTTVDLDMISHYRPRVNVVERPTRTGGGVGYQVTGHHEIMVPLLAWGVAARLG